MREPHEIAEDQRAEIRKAMARGDAAGAMLAALKEAQHATRWMLALSVPDDVAARFKQCGCGHVPQQLAEAIAQAKAAGIKAG